MITRRRLAATCLLLATTTPSAACGLDAAGDAAASETSATTAGSEATEPITPQKPIFGRAYSYPGGMSVTVSAPHAFKPSVTAHPQFEHAVAFELTVLNGTDQPFELSHLRLEASVNGKPASQEIVDSTKGYPGLRGVATQLQPSRTITVLLAYGSEEWPSEAGLRVRVGPHQRAAAEFSGTVES